MSSLTEIVGENDGPHRRFARATFAHQQNLQQQTDSVTQTLHPNSFAFAHLHAITIHIFGLKAILLNCRSSALVKSCDRSDAEILR